MRSETGSAPAEFALASAFLLIPTLLVVSSFAPWVGRQSVARSAAAEAARVVAVSNDAQAEVRASQTVALIGENHGLNPADIVVRYCPVNDGVHSTCLPLRRGDLVRVEVAVRIPAVTFPWGAGFGVAWWTTTHVEPVDLYRSFG